jgi:hypothetical protein
MSGGGRHQHTKLQHREGGETHAPINQIKTQLDESSNHFLRELQ